jgi:membrane associated rhomboid family serine protease
MGLYDRDYTQSDFRSEHDTSPQMRLSWPKLTPVVRWLLIINLAVYIASLLISTPIGDFVYKWGSLELTSPSSALQLWRLITYQFLHDPDNFIHIFFNMLGLFFLGPTLENHWGSRKLLAFYLGCGVAGGLFFMLLVAVHFLSPAPLIGASGSILGMLAACAILFPHFVVFLFIFPVPIRLATIVMAAGYLLIVLTSGQNAGGDACHLAGMAAGAGYVLTTSWREKMKSKFIAGRWEKTINADRDLQIELDRILEKVHKSGIHSLTRKEKHTLKHATEIERRRNM